MTVNRLQSIILSVSHKAQICTALQLCVTSVQLSIAPCLRKEGILQGEGGVTWSLLEPALSTLKHALAAEQSQRGLMRGVKSV